MISKNYHTHTYRCKHALGDCMDYIQVAKNAGLTTLGFSEHMPLPNDRWTHVHLEAEGLEEYVHTVRECDDRTSDLEILLGGECEYIKEEHAYYQEELLDRHQFDYLIGAPHWIPCGSDWVGYTKMKNAEDLRYFASYCVSVIESGLFSYLAHPDVFMVGYKEWDANATACTNDIIDASLELGIPLELNANGLRKSEIGSFDEIGKALYPNISFWQLAAERKVPAIIGSDAHDPDLLTDRIDICEQLAAQLGIKIVDTL